VRRKGFVNLIAVSWLNVPPAKGRAMQPVSILIALLSLIAVLALIFGAGRVARAGFLAPRLAAGGRVSLVQVLALDPRRRLNLVRCDARHVLILTGGAQDVVVGWLDAPAPRAEEPS
jgi:flagellar protein FliO/FliZ